MTLTVALREIGSTYGGLSGKTKTDFGCGDASYVTFLEVINNTRLRGRHLERVRVAKGEQQNRIVRGDLLFNGSSETPEELALSSVVEFNPEVTTFLNSFCFGFRLRPDAPVEAAYLAYFFRSSAGRSLITSLAQGATRYNIAKTKFLDLELVLPTVERQRAIVQSLRDADDLIAGLKRMISKKQAIKQGMMQQLLTGRTRLPGFNVPWREVTIGDLADVVGGGTPSTRIPDLWGGEIPWFTPAEIPESGGGVVTTSDRTITEAGLQESAAKLLPKGTVLVTSRASIGHCAIAGCTVATNQGFTSLVPKNQDSTEFLYYWVQQHRARLVSRAAGSTFLEISGPKVAAIEILAPEADEQVAIGSVLTDADAELRALQRRLAKAQDIKHGMMQELLTGRTRLPVKEIAA